MRQLLKQENGYACGLYAIANLFNDESIITPERLEQSKTGNHIGMLNTWLVEEGKNLFLEPLYFNIVGNKLPDEICDLRPQGEGILSMPVLIDLQYSEDSKMHFVTADLFKNGSIIIFDSLKDEPLLTTLSEYQNNYHRVFGIWYLRDYQKEGYFMRFE